MTQVRVVRRDIPGPAGARERLTCLTAAFEQTVRSSIRLAASLGDDDWDRPTECPGWTVKDQYSHIVGVERLLLGDHEPVPEFPESMPHVRNEFGLLMEHAVQTRRPVPGPAVAAELAEMLERRLAVLRDIDPATRIKCPDGQVGDYVRFMTFRALDCWTHELDIRRAVHRPGNLGAPAAVCFWEGLGNGLRNVVARYAGVDPGRSADFTISGRFSFRRIVVVGDDRTGQVVPALPGPADVTLHMDLETYVRLTAGRCGPDAVHVAVAGDTALGDRILRHMALTP